MLKTFIIDWGENSNGGRYALIQAKSLDDAWFDADMIGGCFQITELKLKVQQIGDATIRYMEFDAIDKPFRGETVANSHYKFR